MIATSRTPATESVMTTRRRSDMAFTLPMVDPVRWSDGRHKTVHRRRILCLHGPDLQAIESVLDCCNAIALSDQSAAGSSQGPPPEDTTKLDTVAARLNELHFVGGEVDGYTDNTGEHDHNVKLSQ